MVTHSARNQGLAFQFTLPCRERPGGGGSSPTFHRFQFTLPCRERPLRLRRTPACSGCFNSRSRVGSDNRPHDEGFPSPRFNSRSRVGSDTAASTHVLVWFLFQFTLPCRERPFLYAGAIETSMFQFTLPCRERPVVHHGDVLHSLFQFTLPCRERLKPPTTASSGSRVSIHAPV